MLKPIIKQIPHLSHIPVKDIDIKKLGGSTNQNYLIQPPTQPYVLRIPREATNAFIQRENEAFNVNQAYQLGLSPETLWSNASGVSLTNYINNAHTLNQTALKSPTTQQKIIALILQLQRSGRTFKGHLKPSTITPKLQDYYQQCSADDQKKLKNDYAEALSILGSLNDPQPLVPSHGDLILENILQQQDKLWLIDWEYSAMASPFWDIAMLCHSANINGKDADLFLENIYPKISPEETKSFHHYQTLVKTINTIWKHAFLR